MGPAMEREDDITAGREAERAADEAGSIGGDAPDRGGDPAERAVEEAGGGESEGFEQAEAALEENAQHGNGGADPEGDALPTEPESGGSGAAYGEADTVESTEAPDRQAERDAELDDTGPDAP